jgi:RsiW-degrading membrane proteinase PrsW (M82 family)
MEGNEMIEYLVLVTAPGIFWLWFFWRRDKYEREPASFLMITFVLGMLAAISLLFLEILLTWTLSWGNIAGFEYTVVKNAIIGTTEEIGKFLVVYWYMYREDEFNEVMDGIVYGAAASLGFASLENLFFILRYGVKIMWFRAVLTTPGHVLFASFWGYALGLKKMTGRNTVVTGLGLAIAAHTVFNIVLESDYWLASSLVLIGALFMVMFWRERRALAMSPFNPRDS